MSLKRPYNRKLRLITHPNYPGYVAFQLADGGDWVVQSKDTGHIYAERFANEDAAKSYIGEYFYGVTPKPPVMRAMAVRCRVGVSPVVFGQVYTAVGYDLNARGHYDQLSVYIPNMWGDYRALPLDASIFDPVKPEHGRRFRHYAVDGFEPISSAIARIVDQFGPGAIMTGRQMAGAA